MPRLTFTREETQDYDHKAAFLHFLHQLEPEVEKTLVELSKFYNILFGKHQPFDRGAIVYPPDFQDLFSQFFTYKSWREDSQPNFSYRVTNYLAKDNELLKTCLEYRNRRWNEIKNSVHKTLSDPQAGEEIRKISCSEDELTGMVYRKVAQDEGYLKSVLEHEESMLGYFSDFRNMFFEGLIERFHLEKEWLCLSAFLAIQEGKSKLQMPSNYTMHVYPIELLRDLHGVKDESFGLRYFPTGLPYPNELPGAASFQFGQPFSVYSNAEEYEKEATTAYGEHIRKYIREMQEALRSHGYKLKRRNSNYSRIKWLVRWTVQGWTMNKILDDYTENEGGPDSIDQDTVWKAFKSFAKYDLPVRKKRKAATN